MPVPVQIIRYIPRYHSVRIMSRASLCKYRYDARNACYYCRYEFCNGRYELCVFGTHPGAETIQLDIMLDSYHILFVYHFAVLHTENQMAV